MRICIAAPLDAQDQSRATAGAPADGIFVAPFEQGEIGPEGKAIESIKKDEPFYGEADILGKSYITGYEPIRDSSKRVIEIYYVGHLK